MNTRSRVAAALTGVLATTSALLVAPPALADDGPGKILLMLDASGSMNGQDPSGQTKMEAAKKALAAAVDTLPPEAQVGLRVYGATQPGGTPTPEACADTQLVHPIGPLDKAGLQSAIASFNARGETPIAHSLAEGAKDLGPDGKRHIILVSDGEESCVPDPCEEVRALVGQGISLQIDTVGFGVDDKARGQLQCIAAAGNGTYYDAEDADQLESSLGRLSTRAMRAFTVQGTPVTGTPQAVDAPLLAPGQYTDISPGSSQGDVLRHYRVRRSGPDTTLRVNILGRLAPGSLSEGIRTGGWEFELNPIDSETTSCSRSWEVGLDMQNAGTLVSGTVVALPIDPVATNPNHTATRCGEASEFVVELTRRAGTSGDVPIEIRVIEEPAVADAASLPRGVASIPTGKDEVASPASGTPAPVVGGASFNDAARVRPGTYVTEVVPGELVFFATDIGWGQSATFAIDGPEPNFPGSQDLSNAYVSLSGSVFAPDLSQIDSQDTWTSVAYRVHRGEVSTPNKDDINQVPQVLFRNRWDSPAMNHGTSRGFAMAGTYYFAVGLPDRVDDLRGLPVPVRFSIAVDGQPQPGPELARPGEVTAPPTSAAVQSPAPSVTAGEPDAGAEATPSASNALLPVVGGTLVGVGVLGGAGYALWRRRP